MTTIESRNDVLYNKLVPPQGKADTLEGEMLRAINRIVYRWYNDGDYWYVGYGTETAGPAETFLRNYSPINLVPDLNASNGTAFFHGSKEDYEQCINRILEKILDYIESRTEFTPNDRDMLDCEPMYEDTRDDEDEDDY